MDASSAGETAGTETNRFEMGMNRDTAFVSSESVVIPFAVDQFVSALHDDENGGLAVELQAAIATFPA